MTRKLFSLLLALIMCVAVQGEARAELQAGMEYQVSEDQEGLNIIKADWWLLSRYGMRASLDVQESTLSADLLYRKNPGGKKTAYMGLGIRDVLNKEDYDLPVTKRMEIIAGMELRLTNRLSVTAETRVVPLSINREGMKPLVGIGFKWVTDLDGAWSERIGPVKNSELKLLARLITAEAGTEPYDGQVAVGAVVVNRLKCDHFPKTIREVIYQDEQFSSLSKLAGTRPTRAALQAAREAIAGTDPSLSALYFYNPRICSPEGLQFFSSGKLQVTVQIGNHIFLKERP
ncbi:MAG: cell wall hydrolase [Bacillota bacterium]